MKNFIVLFFVFNGLSFSAFTQKEPIKYGRLDSIDIHLKAYEGADAVILCDYGYYYFDGKLGPVYFFFKRNLRIKILNENGLRFAKQQISYYDLKEAAYFPYNNVVEFKAQTLNINAEGKIIKSKVKLKALSYTETDAQYNRVISFEFPNAKVGSILEYEINIPTIQTVDLPVWNFESEIPVLHSELRLVAPDGFDYSAKIYGINSPDIFEKTQLVKAISYKSDVLNYQANQLRFAMFNLPANTNEYRSGFERKSLKVMLGYASRKLLPPGMEELIKAMDPEYKYKDQVDKSGTLNNVAYILYTAPQLHTLSKKLLKDQQFGLAMEYGLTMNDSVLKIISGKTTETEKMNSIVNFVSNHIQWDSSYRVFVDPGLSKLILKIAGQFNATPNMNPAMAKSMKTQSGSNSEINFALINFLRKAGIKADPVLTGTLENAFLDTAFFNMHQFNHVVVLAEADNKQYMLDAVQTEKGPLLYAAPMNGFGLAIKPGKAEWISMGEIINSEAEIKKELLRKNGN